MKKTLYLRNKIIKTSYNVFMLIITACALVETMPKVSAANDSELQATDLERIKTGKAAPDFHLESVDGNWVSLSSYQNRKNVILVFYRGHW